MGRSQDSCHAKWNYLHNQIFFSLAPLWEYTDLCQKGARYTGQWSDGIGAAMTEGEKRKSATCLFAGSRDEADGWLGRGRKRK